MKTGHRELRCQINTSFFCEGKFCVVLFVTWVLLSSYGWPRTHTWLPLLPEAGTAGASRSHPSLEPGGSVSVCTPKAIPNQLKTLCFPLSRSVIVGAGYIAVEIAGILSALGSRTSLLIRHDKVSPVYLLLSPFFDFFSRGEFSLFFFSEDLFIFLYATTL